MSTVLHTYKIVPNYAREQRGGDTDHGDCANANTRAKLERVVRLAAIVYVSSVVRGHHFNNVLVSKCIF